MAVCTDLDAAPSVQVFDGVTFVLSSDMEWVADQDGWRAELSDTAGRTLVRLEYDSSFQSIDTKGLLASKLPPMNLVDGYIVIDSWFSGIKPHEVPCLLSGLVPIDWNLRFEYGQDLSEEKLTLAYFKDARREMVVTFARKLMETSFETLCTEIRWNTFFGMRTERINVCVKGSKTRRNRQSGEATFDDIKIKWSDIESH